MNWLTDCLIEGLALQNSYKLIQSTLYIYAKWNHRGTLRVPANVVHANVFNVLNHMKSNGSLLVRLSNFGLRFPCNNMPVGLLFSPRSAICRPASDRSRNLCQRFQIMQRVKSLWNSFGFSLSPYDYMLIDLSCILHLGLFRLAKQRGTETNLDGSLQSRFLHLPCAWSTAIGCAWFFGRADVVRSWDMGFSFLSLLLCCVFLKNGTYWE